MIKSKILILALSIIFIMGCKDDKTKNKKIEKEDSSTEIKLIKELKNQDLIDLEKESKIKFGNYFLTYKENRISLCCQNELHNPFGGLDKESIITYLTDYKIKTDSTEFSYKHIYSKKNSSFTIVELIPEKSGEEGNFISQGKLFDNSVTLSNGIKIGMNKKDFLDRFFIYSENTIDNLKQISVCEDERGELYTKYKFSNRKLTEIEFGSPDEK